MASTENLCLKGFIMTEYILTIKCIFECHLIPSAFCNKYEMLMPSWMQAVLLLKMLGALWAPFLTPSDEIHPEILHKMFELIDLLDCC